MCEVGTRVEAYLTAQWRLRRRRSVWVHRSRYWSEKAPGTLDWSQRPAAWCIAPQTLLTAKGHLQYTHTHTHTGEQSALLLPHNSLPLLFTQSDLSGNSTTLPLHINGHALDTFLCSSSLLISVGKEQIGVLSSLRSLRDMRIHL